MKSDDRTWPQWIRGEWWWYVSRHWTRNAINMRIAWWIPRGVALWVFIRVYSASRPDGGPGSEYRDIYNAWVNGAGK